MMLWQAIISQNQIQFPPRAAHQIFYDDIILEPFMAGVQLYFI